MVSTAATMSGTIDLAYEPRGVEAGSAIAMADWKTGERKPHQVVLDHGYQTSIYNTRSRAAMLWPGTGRETRAFTEASKDVHLRYANHERTRAVLSGAQIERHLEVAVRVARLGWPVSTRHRGRPARPPRTARHQEARGQGHDLVGDRDRPRARGRRDLARIAPPPRRRRAPAPFRSEDHRGHGPHGRFGEQLGEQSAAALPSRCLGDSRVSTATTAQLERARWARRSTSSPGRLNHQQHQQRTRTKDTNTWRRQQQRRTTARAPRSRPAPSAMARADILGGLDLGVTGLEEADASDFRLASITLNFWDDRWRGAAEERVGEHGHRGRRPRTRSSSSWSCTQSRAWTEFVQGGAPSAGARAGT